ncbi:MAG TPA: serine/threonine-protein kinase, partial [Gammaproteobacteria bacterium]
MTFAQPFHDYELLDRVGAGAMGTVFKARHKRLNRIVALKVLKPSLARDARYVDRLRREARIVASLNHPYIVTGYDLGEEGGYHFFVMEFVEGKSLRGLLLEWGMFAEEYVQRVARQVAQALDHAYQRGVIHRDIKPGNILIDESGNVKLTDMGLAKGPADLTLTRDGATVGTPQYISPEQARNPHDVDVRTDLYSLGATLYHMAAGVPPFSGDTMAELITNVLHETPVPPNEHNPALSEGMSLVIRKLLAKDLTVRYQTPRELLDDLERIERALPPQIDAARLSAEAGDHTRWLPRALVAIGVVVLLGAAWWLGVQSRGNQHAEPTASEFLAVLDQELAALPTAWARLERLNAITTSPVGSAHDLQQRERQAMIDLHDAVQRVVDRFSSGRGWEELVAWTREPAVWPDRQRVERERLQPALVAEAGVPLGQPSVRLQRLDDLQAAIEKSLVTRDAELVSRFEQFLATTVAARADQRVRASDFAGAERVWIDALTTFCDGVRLPLQERVAEATQRALKEKRFAAQEAADDDIARAEREVADALRNEVGDM